MESTIRLENLAVSIGDLIARTEAILPSIAERAHQTERERRLPEATIQDIKAAGLNRVMQPVRWGGYGLDFDAYFEICWRISSACGSTGWVYSQSAVQNWEMSFAPYAAQAEFYAKKDPLSCSAFNPSGARVESVDGGWMLSGRWRYSSGVLHADWALLGAKVPEFSTAVLLMVPRGDFNIEDTWHVSGLRGTGSNDVVIDKPVFVPSHRYIWPTAPDNPAAQSSENGSYRVPMPSIAPWGVVVPVIGMAQGALNAYEAANRNRRTAFGGKPMAQMIGPQLRIAEAAANLDAARALARKDIEEVMRRGKAGDTLTNEDRVRLRRDHAFVVDLCFDATMMIARAAGASSLFDTNPIQRFVRDVHAGAMQVAANWDEQAEAYGRVRMGMEPNSTLW
jgi:3-hydroxy-9,10-secoandrosta-1,3,5(10)-triene-9,17-dione monooxygenase